MLRKNLLLELYPSTAWNTSPSQSVRCQSRNAKTNGHLVIVTPSFWVPEVGTVRLIRTLFGGFHIWRPQTFLIFLAPSLSHGHKSADCVPFVCFLGTPSPTHCWHHIWKPPLGFPLVYMLMFFVSLDCGCRATVYNNCMFPWVSPLSRFSSPDSRCQPQTMWWHSRRQKNYICNLDRDPRRFGDTELTR